MGGLIGIEQKGCQSIIHDQDRDLFGDSDEVYGATQ